MTFNLKHSGAPLLFLLTSTFLFTACDKNDKDNDSDTSVATDYYNGQKESDGIIELMNSAAQDNGVLRPDEDYDIQSTLLPACAVVTIDTTSSTKSITIDFGTTGCVSDDWDGKTRKGKIIATWNGLYREEGSTITVTTDNYYVNGNKHEFTKTVVNNGENSDGNLTYSVSVSLAKITFTDGTVLQWTSQRTREWIEGEPTLTPYDDVYSITGSASGTSRNGTQFSMTITNPLEVALACKWIRMGTIVIEPSGKASRTLDFGNGGCDNQATVTILGTTYNITL